MANHLLFHLAYYVAVVFLRLLVYFGASSIGLADCVILSFIRVHIFACTFRMMMAVATSFAITFFGYSPQRKCFQNRKQNKTKRLLGVLRFKASSDSLTAVSPSTSFSLSHTLDKNRIISVSCVFKLSKRMCAIVYEFVRVLYVECLNSTDNAGTFFLCVWVLRKKQHQQFDR